MTELDPTRELHFSLLDMASVSHNNYGLWAHPANRKRDMRTIGYWRELAVEAEAALLDSIFIADVLGIASGVGGSFDLTLREGIHIPELDPSIVAAVMLEATEHLGFGITLSATYDPPFTTARRLATLDHFSHGRVGWNIVMSYQPTANENYGLDASQYSSTERYDRAEDFMDVCYKLWETSWDDDAVVADTDAGVYLDPSKVRRIDHVGPYYRSAGPSLVDPTPQRTPLLFQAGMSDRAREFAARHAEVVFIGAGRGLSIDHGIADIRAKAQGFGRAPGAVKILPPLRVITGATVEEARAKKSDFQARTHGIGYLVHTFGAGFNPLAHPREQPIAEALLEDGIVRNDSGMYGYPDGTTVGGVIDQAADLESGGFFFACSDGAGVADRIEELADEHDIDGFLLSSLVYPGSLRDFRVHVVPELQRRGRYRTHYPGNTLRESVFGPGRSRIADEHPAGRLRAGQHG